MNLKKLMNKAGHLAEKHGDRLGPLGKKAAGFLGDKRDTKPRKQKARRPAIRRSR